MAGGIWLPRGLTDAFHADASGQHANLVAEHIQAAPPIPEPSPPPPPPAPEPEPIAPPAPVVDTVSVPPTQPPAVPDGMSAQPPAASPTPPPPSDPGSPPPSLEQFQASAGLSTSDPSAGGGSASAPTAMPTAPPPSGGAGAGTPSLPGPPSLQDFQKSAGLIGDTIGGAVKGAADAVTSTVGAAFGGGTAPPPPSLQDFQKSAGLLTPETAAPSSAAPGGGYDPSSIGRDPLVKAQQFLGQPYVWGGKSAQQGFDCSGLAGYLAGTGQPESTVSLYGKSAAVDPQNLQTGDLVFYNMGQSDPHIQHVGTYIGDGKLVQAGGDSATVNVADINQQIGSAPEFRRIGAAAIPTGSGKPAQADLPGAPTTETTAGMSGGGALAGKIGEAGQAILSGGAQAASWLGDAGQKALQAVLVTEGGLNKARGDGGASAGPLQFYEGGQLANLAKQLGVTMDAAKTWVEDNPIKAVQWAIGTPDAPGYLGAAIQAGLKQGLGGADLATYAQRTGQVSVSPERAGQNYDAMFGGGGGLVSGAAGGATTDPYGDLAKSGQAIADQGVALNTSMQGDTDRLNAQTTQTQAQITTEADRRAESLRQALDATVASGASGQAAAATGTATPLPASPAVQPDQNPLQRFGSQLTDAITGMVKHLTGQGGTSDQAVSPVPAPGGGYDPSSMHGSTPPTDTGIPARPVGAPLPSGGPTALDQFGGAVGAAANAAGGALPSLDLSIPGGNDTPLGRSIVGGQALSPIDQIIAGGQTFIGYEGARAAAARNLDPLRALSAPGVGGVADVAEAASDPLFWLGVTGKIPDIAGRVGGIAAMSAADQAIDPNDPNRGIKQSLAGIVGGMGAQGIAGKLSPEVIQSAAREGTALLSRIAPDQHAALTAVMQDAATAGKSPAEIGQAVRQWTLDNVVNARQRGAVSTDFATGGLLPGRAAPSVTDVAPTAPDVTTRLGFSPQAVKDLPPGTGGATLRRAVPELWQYAHDQGVEIVGKPLSGTGGWLDTAPGAGGQFYKEGDLDTVLRGPIEAVRNVVAHLMDGEPNENAAMLVHQNGGMAHDGAVAVIRLDNVAAAEAAGLHQAITDISPDGWHVKTVPGKNGTTDLVIAGPGQDPVAFDKDVQRHVADLQAAGYTVQSHTVEPASVEFMTQDDAKGILNGRPESTAATPGGITPATDLGGGAGGGAAADAGGRAAVAGQAADNAGGVRNAAVAGQGPAAGATGAPAVSYPSPHGLAVPDPGYVPGTPEHQTEQLLRLGYDGIKFGERATVAGEQLNHTAVAVFPKATDKLRNAISGRQGGQVDPRFAANIAGAAAGGAVGNATTPDDATPLERAGRIAAFGAAGLGATHLAGSLAGLKPDTAGAIARNMPATTQAGLPGMGSGLIHPRIQQLLGDHPEYAQIAQDGLDQLQATNAAPDTIARYFAGVERSSGLPSGIDANAWFRSLRNGAMAGGLQTLGHVMFNIPMQVLWGIPRDVIAAGLRGTPEQIPAGIVGMFQGHAAAAEAALEQLRYGITAEEAGAGGRAIGTTTSAATALSPSIGLRTDNRALQLGANLLTGTVGTHGAAQTYIQQLGFYKRATEMAWTQAKTEGLSGNLFTRRVADIMGNLTDPQYANIATEATNFGNRMALRGAQGRVGTALQKVAGAGIGGNLLIPFESIANKVLTGGVEATPGLGGLGLGIDLAKARFGAGPYAAGATDVTRGAVTPVAERAANQLLGTGVFAMGLGLAGAGILVGSGPSSPQERATALDAGQQFDGINIGGKFVPGHMLGRLWYPLAAAANTVEAQRYAKAGATPTEMIADGIQRTAAFFENETFMRQFGDLAAALKDHTGRQLENFVARQAETLIPQDAVGRDVGSIMDPSQRAPSNTGDIPTDVGSRIAAQLPILRQSQPPRINATTGFNTPNRTGLIGTLAHPALPQDPLATEVMRLEMAGQSLGINQPKANYLGGAQSPDQLVAAQRMGGAANRNYGLAAMSDPAYANLNDAQKADALRKAMSQGSTAANITLGATVARDPYHTAVLQWAQTPHYSGVKGSPTEVAQQNLAIAQAKSKLAEYKKALGTKAEMRMRLDDPAAFKLTQRDRVDADKLARAKKAIDDASGGALSKGASSAVAGGAYSIDPMALEPPP